VAADPSERRDALVGLEVLPIEHDFYRFYRLTP
jgi:hypothetical protein